MAGHTPPVTGQTFFWPIIGVAVFGSSFVAGIGNYLRSEILFSSRVNPLDRPKDLTRRQLGALARNTLGLTRQAYATSGVTNTPGRGSVCRPRDCRDAATDIWFLIAPRSLVTSATIPLSVLRSVFQIYLCQICQPRLRGGVAQELT